MTTPADKTLDDVEANAGAMREEDAFDVAAVREVEAHQGFARLHERLQHG